MNLKISGLIKRLFYKDLPLPDLPVVNVSETINADRFPISYLNDLERVLSTKITAPEISVFDDVDFDMLYYKGRRTRLAFYVFPPRDAILLRNGSFLAVLSAFFHEFGARESILPPRDPALNQEGSLSDFDLDKCHNLELTYQILLSEYADKYYCLNGKLISETKGILKIAKGIRTRFVREYHDGCISADKLFSQYLRGKQNIYYFD